MCKLILKVQDLSACANQHDFSLVKEKKNVIIRNIAISKVLAENGDAIGVRKFQTSYQIQPGLDWPPTEYSTNVWIDHVDVSSDKDHDKDYYDGLIDVGYSLQSLPK